MIDVVNDGLFEIDEPTPRGAEGPTPMTLQQREIIRQLFAQIGIVDARAQFEMVTDLTGVKISSVSEMEVATANTLIHHLSSRVVNSRRASTGNTWADRDEDTWIDRL
ncbi:hypothetical protein [Microbacterium lacticum]